MVAPQLRDVDLVLPRVGFTGARGRVTEATVRCWTGRHATNCTVVVDYGTTTAYGTTTPVTQSANFQQVPLGDLTPGTYYHFRDDHGHHLHHHLHQRPGRPGGHGLHGHQLRRAGGQPGGHQRGGGHPH